LDEKAIVLQKKLMSIYRKLENEYGPQNWWPADSPYEVMVGAILTQNTNWNNVEKAIENLKEKKLLEPKAILKTPINELENLVRPSGFYKQKAERLKLASKKWIELNEKELETHELRSAWLSVKGIGKETADSICLFAFNRLIFVIDTYTRRFCKHYNLIEAKEYDEYRAFFESKLPRSVQLYKEYHALIVEWGKSKREMLH
jgi:endonuclease-3 related protein